MVGKKGKKARTNDAHLDAFTSALCLIKSLTTPKYAIGDWIDGLAMGERYKANAAICGARVRSHYCWSCYSLESTAAQATILAAVWVIGELNKTKQCSTGFCIIVFSKTFVWSCLLWLSVTPFIPHYFQRFSKYEQTWLGYSGKLVEVFWLLLILGSRGTNYFTHLPHGISTFPFLTN